MAKQLESESGLPYGITIKNQPSSDDTDTEDPPPYSVKENADPDKASPDVELPSYEDISTAQVYDPLQPSNFRKYAGSVIIVLLIIIVLAVWLYLLFYKPDSSVEEAKYNLPAELGFAWQKYKVYTVLGNTDTSLLGSHFYLMKTVGLAILYNERPELPGSKTFNLAVTGDTAKHIPFEYTHGDLKIALDGRDAGLQFGDQEFQGIMVSS